MALGGRHHPIWTLAAAAVLIAAGLVLLWAGVGLLAVALIAYGAVDVCPTGDHGWGRGFVLTPPSTLSPSLAKPESGHGVSARGMTLCRDMRSSLVGVAYPISLTTLSNHGAIWLDQPCSRRFSPTGSATRRLRRDGMNRTSR